MLAGGSGQYVTALLEGWQPPRVPPDEALRAEFEALAAAEGPEAVHARLAALDPAGAATLDPQNLRRVSRALEVVHASAARWPPALRAHQLTPTCFIIGLQLDREALYQRLDTRTDAMYAAGFIDEVQRLRDAGLGDTSPVRGGVGYKEASLYLDGAIDLEEAVRRHKNANHRLVRRQGAWFKQDDPRITWLDAAADAPSRAVAAVRTWLRARQA